MGRTLVIVSLLLILSCGLSAQHGNHVVYTTVYNGDTIPYIRFREVLIMPPRVFSSSREAKRYKKLIRKIKKVLPYARIAANKLCEIEEVIATIDTEREKRRFINQKDKELKSEFEGELRELTVSEGILLIKLIDRETGDTSYELIRELKGSFTAFMWQAVARMFGSNLKLEYDAVGEDKLIEEIIIRIDGGLL